MKRLLHLALRSAISACLMTSAGGGELATPSDPSGTWTAENGETRIRIEDCGPAGEQRCGYLVWMRQPANAQGHLFKDQSNPSPGKRSRPLLGHQLAAGLKRTQDGRYEGTIYNADRGKFYSVTLWRETPTRLRIRECMLIMLCTTRSWLQAADILPGQLAGRTGDANGPKPDREWARQSRGASQW